MSLATPDGARAALKAATSDAHERCDVLFARFDLAWIESYRRFLRAHADAFLPVEAALDHAGAERLIDDWPARRRSQALCADLMSLGCKPQGGAPFFLANDHAAWGALYVLEGSRLGGAMLSRTVCAGLPASYLGTPPPPGAWRKLLESLELGLYGQNAQASAIEAAREVFARFESAARHQLKQVDR